jgi:type VI secretion system secreted protein Hcp
MHIPTMKQTLLASTMLVSILASATATAAIDMFIKIDGIEGESTDARNRGASDVLAWSWGLGQSAITKKPCIQSISLTKYFDSASPKLIASAANGTSAPQAVLKLRKAGEQPLDYLVITMSNVQVSSFSTGGSGGEDRITENVTLSFDSMDGAYKKQNADGTLGTAIPWNIGAGGKC